MPLSIGAWNVGALINKSDRPQRRIARVGRELGRYRIAVLSETRLPEVGEIKEIGTGNTFSWRTRKSEERREAGVGSPSEQTFRESSHHGILRIKVTPDF